MRDGTFLGMTKATWKDLVLLGSVLFSVAMMASYWHLWKERYPFFNVETTVTITGDPGPGGEPNEVRITGRGLEVEVAGEQWSIEGFRAPHRFHPDGGKEAPKKHKNGGYIGLDQAVIMK